MEDDVEFKACVAKQGHKYPVLSVLEALKEASQQLQANSHDSNSSIKALLELQNYSNSILSSDPHLSTLSSHLPELKNLIQIQEESKSKHGIRSFLAHRARAHEISRVSSLIESEIQAWIDRETVNDLSRTLEDWLNNGTDSSPDEEPLLTKLSQFRARLAQGFDIVLQGLLLKSGIFSQFESLLCRNSISKRVREVTAYSIKEIVLFNKDVFVGQVLVGQTIKALSNMEALCGLDVLKSLITAIKSPLVDELECSGGILKIIHTLNSSDLGLKIMAMNCILELGYFGRKEAIEAILNAGLIKKLVDLQRSELGGDLIETESKGRREKRFIESHPFSNCVARFTVQLEVGEGLRQREKRAFKQEILKRIREASVSDAEAASIVAEVLWGSSP